MADEVKSPLERMLTLVEASPDAPISGALPHRGLPPVSQSDAEAQQREEPQAAAPLVEGAEAPVAVTVEEPIPEPRKLRVKVDGTETELPEDEVVRGFQFNAHNTQTAMRLSEDRKAAQAAAHEAVQARDTLKAKLAAMDEALGAMQPAQPDWGKLRAENPQEFAVQWADHQQLTQARARVAQERLQIQQQEAEEAVARQHATIAENRQRLLDALPDWKDPVKKQQDDAKLLEVGRSYGYSDQELGEVTDFRAVLVLRDAMLYRELQAKKADLPKAGTSPVLKPAAATPPAASDTEKEYQAKRAKLRETGHPKDAVAAVLAALNRP